MKVMVCLERESVKQQISVAVHGFFSMSVFHSSPSILHRHLFKVMGGGGGGCCRGAVEVSLDVI